MTAIHPRVYDDSQCTTRISRQTWRAHEALQVADFTVLARTEMVHHFFSRHRTFTGESMIQLEHSQHREKHCIYGARTGRCRWPIVFLITFYLFVLNLFALALTSASAEFLQKYNIVHYPDHNQLLTWKDEKGNFHPVRTIDEWNIRRGHIVTNFEAVAGRRPDQFRDPEQITYQTLETVSLGNLVRKKITIPMDDNDVIHAYLFLPVAKAKLAAMLCLHQTTKTGKGEPAGLSGLPTLHYALELAQRGYVTLAPDYPRFGDSTTDAYHLGYLSATAKGIANHRKCVSLLTQLPEVDAERIGCIGHSLGGHNSIFVALYEPRIKVIATSCGFCSFPKYYGGNLKGWTHAGYMPRIASVFASDPKKVPFDFTELLAALAPRPVFINAPLRDANFDVEGVRDCVKAALPVYQLFAKPENLHAVYPDAEHAFPDEIRLECYSFLDLHLRLRRERR
jgi:dienelactone hydrolase